MNSLHAVMTTTAVLFFTTVLTAGDNPKPTPKTGYNTPWPQGRGFRIGQTVPDIPLYDMKGNEVRFSKFLGKQCVLYVWASW